MYALVEILGHQYKVEEGKTLRVDHIAGKEEGSSFEIDRVLALVDGDVIEFGTPYIKGVTIKAKVGSEEKGEKIKVYKFHRRKGYRRTQGHREIYTNITIEKILA